MSETRLVWLFGPVIWYCGGLWSALSRARAWVWAGALAWLLATSSTAFAAPNVTRIERYASRDAARVVLYVSEPVSFERPSVEGERDAKPRLFVDVPGATYAGSLSFDMKGLVERLELSPSENRLRVGFELSDPARASVFFLPQPFRVVIDIGRATPATAVGLTERSVRRIALDPGHGGSESGATGPRGIREKDIVLDIAHRAAPLLARELGISTVLTRDTDDRVPLEERVAKANAFGADLFLSIHCNADPSHSARGVISFVLDGSHDRRQNSLLERENAAPIASPDDFRRFLEQFDDRVAAARSTTFARLLQRSAMASLAPGYTDVIDGGVRGAGFYVLVGARMPAVLFETSFVSNELEGTRLGTARYRQKLADAIVNAVRAYKSGY